MDGASIPKVFWSIIGGPPSGPYRNASIVHDEACERKTEPSADVHFMFYEAYRCAGLGENQAKIMYAAVYHFGPHWEIKTVQEVSNLASMGVLTRFTCAPHYSATQPGSGRPASLVKRIMFCGQPWIC